MSVSTSSNKEKEYMIYCDDLRKHLSHHNIKVEVISVEKSAKGIGATILESALEFDADLIVIGAYGHTRLKEIILGGVTKYLLKHTTIPLFLSH